MAFVGGPLVGLDIGTSAIRAAQVKTGRGGGAVTAFGQVPLPPDVVVDGEIRDGEAVAEAIAQLWKRAKFRSKRVVIGIANQRVVVRQIDLPYLDEKELRDSLRFQVADHVPMPVEDAELDFEIIEDFQTEGGDHLMRVLLVAAASDMVNGFVQAASDGGLDPAGVDLTPFAVTRAVSPAARGEVGAAGAEAVVDVGAGVTNIVVHEGGRIRFTRTLPNLGGDDFTETIVEQLRVSREDAERMKRQTSMRLHPTSPAAASIGHARVKAARARDTESAEPVATVSGSPAWGPVVGGNALAGQEPASASVAIAVDPAQDEPAGHSSNGDETARALEPMVDRLVGEIRGSIEFYTAQNPTSPLERIVLTGGGSLIDGLIGRIESSLGLHTEPGHPFERAPIGKIKVSKHEVTVAEPFMGVAVGLALAGSGA